MKTDQVIDNIRQVASTVLPQGSKLFLFGSRATAGSGHFVTVTDYPDPAVTVFSWASIMRRPCQPVRENMIF